MPSDCAAPLFRCETYGSKPMSECMKSCMTTVTRARWPSAVVFGSIPDRLIFVARVETLVSAGMTPTGKPLWF